LCENGCDTVGCCDDLGNCTPTYLAKCPAGRYLPNQQCGTPGFACPRACDLPCGGCVDNVWPGTCTALHGTIPDDRRCQEQA
jgi:hypothetical protein